MFYEDILIGQSVDLGQTEFSREAILAYGKKFDPRIVAQAADRSARLAAAGMHVAAAGMRRLVDTRSALRAALAERGESLPQLGVSPGFKDMRWPYPVREGDIVSYSVEPVSKRETSKPRTIPTRPMPTSVTTRSNPSRSPAAVAVCPRSPSTTTISSRGHPRATARSRSAYCRLVLSVFSKTCRIVDCRT